jgi:hypothetical protein
MAGRNLVATIKTLPRVNAAGLIRSRRDGGPEATDGLKPSPPALHGPYSASAVLRRQTAPPRHQQHRQAFHARSTVHRSLAAIAVRDPESAMARHGGESDARRQSVSDAVAASHLFLFPDRMCAPEKKTAPPGWIDGAVDGSRVLEGTSRDHPAYSYAWPQEESVCWFTDRDVA